VPASSLPKRILERRRYLFLCRIQYPRGNTEDGGEKEEKNTNRDVTLPTHESMQPYLSVIRTRHKSMMLKILLGWPIRCSPIGAPLRFCAGGRTTRRRPGRFSTLSHTLRPYRETFSKRETRCSSAEEVTANRMRGGQHGVIHFQPPDEMSPTGPRLRSSRPPFSALSPFKY
jgi:hypothetical protein